MLAIEIILNKIFNNDYVWFEKKINDPMTLDIICEYLESSKYCALSDSIKYRAKECFDIILSNSKIQEIIKRDAWNNNYLSIALERYRNFSSPENEYYVNKLLEHQVSVPFFEFTSQENSDELNNKLFINLPKDEDTITESIKDFGLNNMNMFYTIYRWLDMMKPDFYSTKEKQIQFNTTIFWDFICSIRRMNIGDIRSYMHIINYYISKKVNWKVYEDYFNEKTHILYVLLCSHSILFDFFYNKFSKVSKKELNMIPEIITIKLELDLINDNIEKIEASNYYNNMKNLMKLKIKFDNLGLSVFNMFCSDYDLSYFTEEKHKFHLHMLIYIVFMTGRVITNPLNYINNTMMLSMLAGNARGIKKEFKMRQIRNFVYINNHFGHNAPDSIDDVIKYAFPRKIESYQFEREEFIKELQKTFQSL